MARAISREAGIGWRAAPRPSQGRGGTGVGLGGPAFPARTWTPSSSGLQPGGPQSRWPFWDDVSTGRGRFGKGEALVDGAERPGKEGCLGALDRGTGSLTQCPSPVPEQNPEAWGAACTGPCAAQTSPHSTRGVDPPGQDPRHVWHGPASTPRLVTRPAWCVLREAAGALWAAAGGGLSRALVLLGGPAWLWPQNVSGRAGPGAPTPRSREILGRRPPGSRVRPGLRVWVPPAKPFLQQARDAGGGKRASQATSSPRTLPARAGPPRRSARCGPCSPPPGKDHRTHKATLRTAQHPLRGPPRRTTRPRVLACTGAACACKRDSGDPSLVRELTKSQRTPRIQRVFSPNKVAASEALRPNWDSRNLGPNVDMPAMSVASVAPARHSKMNVGFFSRSQMELDGETREKRQRVRAGQSREEVPFQRGLGSGGPSTSPPGRSGRGVRPAENQLQESKPLNQPPHRLRHSSALARGETPSNHTVESLGGGGSQEPGAGGGGCPQVQDWPGPHGWGPALKAGILSQPPALEKGAQGALQGASGWTRLVCTSGVVS